VVDPGGGVNGDVRLGPGDAGTIVSVVRASPSAGLPLVVTLTGGATFSAEDSAGALATTATLGGAGDYLQLMFLASGALTNAWVVLGHAGAMFS
jgi:hypothetical protein